VRQLPGSRLPGEVLRPDTQRLMRPTKGRQWAVEMLGDQVRSARTCPHVSGTCLTREGSGLVTTGESVGLIRGNKGEMTEVFGFSHDLADLVRKKVSQVLSQVLVKRA